MGFDLTLPLRGLQLLFDIIAIGLIGYVVDAFADSPSRVSFFLFTSIFTLFALAFLVAIPRFVPKLANPIILLVVEAITMLFWFAAFIALAVWVSDIPDGFCNRICKTTKAAVAFGAFEWLLWTATTVLTALKAFRGGSTATKPTAGGPTVSV